MIPIAHWDAGNVYKPIIDGFSCHWSIIHGMLLPLSVCLRCVRSLGIREAINSHDPSKLSQARLPVSLSIAPSCLGNYSEWPYHMEPYLSRHCHMTTMYHVIILRSLSDPACWHPSINDMAGADHPARRLQPPPAAPAQPAPRPLPPPLPVSGRHAALPLHRPPHLAPRAPLLPASPTTRPLAGSRLPAPAPALQQEVLGQLRGHVGGGVR